MSSSNTRATRSRYSSPAQTQTPNWTSTLEVPKSSENQGSRAFMQRWLEPSVQSKPSFEEAGLVRHGVVESMAPLGSLPKPKKALNENGTVVRKIILRPSGAKKTEDSTEAKPKPTPAVSSTIPKQLETQLLAGKAEDVEYNATEVPRRRVSRRVTLPSKKLQQQLAAEWDNSTAVTDVPDARELVTPRRTSRRCTEDRGITERVVEVAVDEALKHYRYPTAWALKTLIDEKSGDTDFESMLTHIFSQSADRLTREEFSKQVQEKKREGKRDDQAYSHFIPSTTNSLFTLPKPKAASYAELIQSPNDEGEGRVVKKIKTSYSESAPAKLACNNDQKMEEDVGKTSTRKRTRRHSRSSDSSLSSALSLSSPEVRVTSLSPSLRKGATSAGVRAQDAPKSQPITTTAGKSTTIYKQTVPIDSEPNSPTSLTCRAHASTAHGSMLGRPTASELFSNLQTRPNNPPRDGANSPVRHDEDGSVWTRRRDAQEITNNYSAIESSVRERMDEQVSTPVRKSKRTRQSLAVPISLRSTRSAKRPNEDDDSTSSPAALPLSGEETSVDGSRATTPNGVKLVKKAKSGLRVKSSPVKKTGGTAAGVPRPVGDLHMPGGGTPKEQGSDNDEYCSACGNTGDVVCCDGCPRSFHFECVNMAQSEDLPDEWYCNECLVRRFPSRVPIHKGAFASALNNLEKSIPRAFSLPKKVQNRFEGVKAGADGDFEEIATNKAPKRKSGFDEVPDFFKQREDGNPVLCHACQKPSTDVRAILSCSACPLYWHLDCLDPPLAVPPVLKTWRCPAHVDDILQEAPPLAPAHKFRKVKNSQVISPIFARGMRNNGHIEVDWSDELDQARDSGWPDPRSFGRSYKVPAHGVVLDFIEQLRRQGAGYGTREAESKWLPSLSLSTTTKLHDSLDPLLGSHLGRQIDELQASLNLIGLKQSRTDSIDVLISTLLTAVDANVLALMAQGNASNIASGDLTEHDKQSLRTMLVQMDVMSGRIRQLLGGKPQSSTTPTSIPGAATPPAERHSTLLVDTKDETFPLITEPTPPSTVDHAEGSMELD